MKESSQNEVVLEGIRLNGFKQLMECIYTGQLILNDADLEMVLELLSIAHQYGYEKIQIAIGLYLEGIVSSLNVCKIFSRAVHLELGSLKSACYRRVQQDPDAFLDSEDLCELSATALRGALSRDTFFTEEINIFKAVERWCKQRPDQKHSFPAVLETIRLPLIATTDIVTVVDSGLMTKDCLWEAIRLRKSCPAQLRYRGHLIPNANLATPAHNATYLTESLRESIVTSGTRPLYESEVFSPSIEFEFSTIKWLRIRLRKPFLVNHVSFELQGEISSPWSYIISVSVNLRDWIPLIDHSRKDCHSFQNLYFEPRVVQYIEINMTKTPGTPCARGFGVFFTTSAHELTQKIGIADMEGKKLGGI